MTILELLDQSGVRYKLKEAGNVYTDCPACGRSEKFSISLTDFIGHCWACEHKASESKIREELGLTQETATKAPAETKKKELTPEETKAIEATTMHLTELMAWAVSRSLDPEWVSYQASYYKRIGYDPAQRAVVFIYTEDGKVVGAKYKHAQGQYIKGREPLLYVPKEGDLKKEKIVLVEGEVDALTLAQFGIPVAATLGATKTKGLELLNTVRQVYIGFDNDDAGKTGAESAAKALGAYKCRRVTWDHKDPNDALKAGWGKPEFVQRVKDAEPFAIALKSKSAHVALDEFLDLAARKEKRLSWGFPKLDSLTRGIGGGELIGVLAQAGTGKSTFCFNSACFNAKSGVEVGIVSLEENILTEVTPKLVATLVARNPGSGGFSQEELLSARTALKRIHLFTGDADLASVSEFAREVYHVHGVRILYLDYFQLITPDETNVQEVKSTVYALKKLTKELPELCIVVIIQPKQTQRARNKDGSEAAPPKLDLQDARGGAAIGQGVDALLTITAVPNHSNVTQYEFRKVRGHLRVSKKDWLGQVVQLEYDHATMRMSELDRIIFSG